jgi:hypothetical protein
VYNRELQRRPQHLGLYIMISPIHPDTPSPRRSRTPFVRYNARRNASPKVTSPYAANKDSMMGTGLRSRMARGNADPPRTREASRLSSTP